MDGGRELFRIGTFLPLVYLLGRHPLPVFRILLRTKPTLEVPLCRVHVSIIYRLE